MTLSETWFLEGYIDFELQKYRLLAYLQDVKKYFNETKLYPKLSDVIFHYNNLSSFIDSKKFLQEHFPKHVEGIYAQTLDIIYKKMITDSELMQEIQHITQYALDELKSTISSGTEIYDLVEKQLHIEPVGIVPLYKNEGYLLLQYSQYAEIRAYNYTITLFEHKDAKYKGIRVQYMDSWNKSIVNTYSQIKRDIIRLNRTLPNPAVYSVEFPMNVPLDETLLPIAKRVLVRYIDVA